MQIAIIGLGRMGGNIVRRLMRGGHEVVAFDRSAEAVDALAGEGATPAHSLEEVVAAHRTFVDAGAEVVIGASYQASHAGYARAGLTAEECDADL